MAVVRVGEVLKAVLVGALALAQLFVSRLGIFGDRRHSKAENRIFRSVIVILPWTSNELAQLPGNSRSQPSNKVHRCIFKLFRPRATMAFRFGVRANHVLRNIGARYVVTARRYIHSSTSPKGILDLSIFSALFIYLS